MRRTHPSAVRQPIAAVFSTSRSRRILSPLVWAVVALGLTLYRATLPVFAAPQSLSVAAVVALSGPCQVHRANTKRLSALIISQSLAPGDVVRTGDGGKVSILFEDGSQLKLGPDTQVRITAPTPVRNKTSFFAVVAGEIWARLRPGRAVRTGYSNLIVRGTEIDLNVAASGSATVTVLEGQVEFFNAAGTVLVNQAQQSTIVPGMAPTRPVTVGGGGGGLIVEWTLDLNRAFPAHEKFYAHLDAAAAQTALATARAAVHSAVPATGPPTPAAAAASLQLGDALFDSGHFDEALAAYNRAATGTATLAVRRGYALLALGRLDESAAAFEAAGPANGLATTGLAWVALHRNAPARAEALAHRALASSANDASVSSEAQLVLGLSLMRQPGHEKEAATALEAAQRGPAATVGYQAAAWQALLAMAQDDAQAARRLAGKAVGWQPRSALANACKALVLSYSGQSAEAGHWARAAIRFNPSSVAGLLAAAQVELLNANTLAAASAAARAAALDPDLPEAFYLLGLADADAGDYGHAERELKTALRLAPDYLAAAAALARVDMRLGRPEEAQALLADMAQRHPDSDTLLAARGEIAYLGGRYTEALDAYRTASRQHPESALTWAGLARLAMDANHLSEAITAARNATRLAPDVSQYHSVLGLAYNYAHLDAQAEREFRTALQIDPTNALALVQLGQQNNTGDAFTTARTHDLAFVQGFLLDPGVTRDFLRGGVNTELVPDFGNHQKGLGATTRAVFGNGKGHLYATGQTSRDSGDRPNARQDTIRGSVDATYVPNTRTTLYVHGLLRQDDNQVPGTTMAPVGDDNQAFRFGEGIAAARYRVNDRQALSLGLYASRQAMQSLNPNSDFSQQYQLSGGFGLAPISPREFDRSRGIEPEIRYDLLLGARPSHRTSLSLGAARPRISTRSSNQLFFPGPPDFAGASDSTIVQPAQSIYAELSHQFSARASLGLQLRHERLRSSGNTTFSVPPFLNGTGSSDESSSRWLPSMVGNYSVSRSTQLRLLAGRRITQSIPGILAPLDTSLITEAQTLPNSLPGANNSGDLRFVEFDAEHTFRAGDFVKLFAFHSVGRNMNYDFGRFLNPNDLNSDFYLAANNLQFDRLDRRGVGVHYERTVTHNLFAQLGAAFNHTTSRANFFDPFALTTTPTLYDNAAAPYNPRLTANLGLNYVDDKGYKAGLMLNYAGAYFADTDDHFAVSRPRFGAKTTLDLSIGREPTLRTEYSLAVTNVFNTNQLIYNGIPINPRRVVVQITRRF